MISSSWQILTITLRWRHNGHDGVSNHQPHDCPLNRSFRRRSKKTSKLRVTGLCAGIPRWPVNSPYKWPVTRKMFPFDDVIMSMTNSQDQCNKKMSLSMHDKLINVLLLQRGVPPGRDYWNYIPGTRSCSHGGRCSNRMGWLQLGIVAILSQKLAVIIVLHTCTTIVYVIAHLLFSLINKMIKIFCIRAGAMWSLHERSFVICFINENKRPSWANGIMRSGPLLIT